MTNEELFDSIYNTGVDPKNKNNQNSTKRLQLSSDCFDAYRRFMETPGVTEEIKKAFRNFIDKMDILSEFDRVDMYGIGFRQGGKFAFAMMETPMNPDPDEEEDIDLSFDKSALLQTLARARAEREKENPSPQ